MIAKRNQRPVTHVAVIQEQEMDEQDKFDPIQYTDCLPFFGTNRNFVDAEVEAAYRRGYAQGAAQTLYAVQEGVPLAKVENWIFGKLWEWRYKWRQWKTQQVKGVLPPDRPRRPAHDARRSIRLNR